MVARNERDRGFTGHGVIGMKLLFGGRDVIRDVICHLSLPGTRKKVYDKGPQVNNIGGCHHYL